MFASLLAGALLAASAPAPAPAADPAPGPGWSLDRAEHHCSLVRQEGPATFVLRTMPGSGIWELRVASREWSNVTVRNPRRLAIGLQPAGAAFPGRLYVRHFESGPALVVYQIPRAHLGDLAAAEGITASRGDETILDLPLTGAAQAIAAVRQCEDEALREWGVDPRAFAALRSPPVGVPAAVVTDSDYPPSAVLAHQSGTTIARLSIDVRGRVSDCVPVVSSGHAILDERSCAIFRERLRMTPAIGADGAPTAAPVVTPIRWLLPG